MCETVSPRVVFAMTGPWLAAHNRTSLFRHSQPDLSSLAFFEKAPPAPTSAISFHPLLYFMSPTPPRLSLNKTSPPSSFACCRPFLPVSNYPFAISELVSLRATDITICTMPSAVKPPQTLYDKVFQDHIVEQQDDGSILLYIGMSCY